MDIFSLNDVVLLLAGALTPFVVGLKRYMTQNFNGNMALVFTLIVSFLMAIVGKVVYGLISGEPLFLNGAYFYQDSVGVFAVSQIVFAVFKDKKMGKKLGRVE